MLIWLVSFGAVRDGSIIFNYSEDVKLQREIFERVARSGEGVEVSCWGVGECGKYVNVLNVEC